MVIINSEKIVNLIEILNPERLQKHWKDQIQMEFINPILQTISGKT